MLRGVSKPLGGLAIPELCLVVLIARKRLAVRKLTAVDPTNIRPKDRKPLVALAREFHCLPVAFVLDVPKDVCIEPNRDRPDRNFGPRVVLQQVGHISMHLRQDARGIKPAAPGT